MVQVTFDEQAFTFQRQGGISRYFGALINRMASDSSLGVEPRLAFWLDQNCHAPGIQIPDSVPKRFATTLAFAANTPLRLRRADVIHNTFYHPRFLRSPRGRRRVATLHDMIPEQFPKLFPENPHLAKHQYFKESDLIISVSNHSRNMLEQFWPDITSKVCVIPLGVDDKWFSDQPSQIGPPPDELARNFGKPNLPYVVFVGSRAFHKDFGVALDLLEILKDEEVNLVAIGGGPWTESELSRIRTMNLTGRIQQVQLTDKNLRVVLGRAICLLMTSRAEGFGLPLLESFALGTPVVAARIPTQEEFAGGLSLLFEPGDARKAAQLILRLLDQTPETRSKEGALRIDHARKFTWDRTAQLTAQAYKELQ